MTVCFLDNDVIIKLTTCGLLSEALECLKIDQSGIRVLDSARFFFLKNREMRKKHSKEVLEFAVDFVEKHTTISAEDNEDYKLLITQNSNGIDPGEAKLISATIQDSSYCLFTGDKRCLRALYNAKELSEIHSKLQGRVICLEQIICELIKVYGFELIREKIVPARDCDQVLKAAFGSGHQSQKEITLEMLNSKIKDLRIESGYILMEYITN
jgi:hypothetical protein